MTTEIYRNNNMTVGIESEHRVAGISDIAHCKFKAYGQNGEILYSEYCIGSFSQLLL